MIAQLAEYSQQHPAAAVLSIGQIKPASFDYCIPFMDEMPVCTQHIEVSPTVKEILILPVLSHLTVAICVLAAYGPTRCQIIHDIYRSNMASLDKVRRCIVAVYLTGRRDIVEVSVLEQRI